MPTLAGVPAGWVRRTLRVAARVGGTALVVLVLGVALAVHLGLFGLHVVTSSSMQPTLRVGDLLVTRAVPAADVRVGQIVTLMRPDGHLVTHRVLASTPDPDGTGRLITMRGDHNDVADPDPYPVETVEATLVRLPALGGIVQRASRPPVNVVVMASLALLVLAPLVPPRSSRVPRRPALRSETPEP